MDADWSEQKFDLFGIAANARRLYGQNTFFGVAVGIYANNPRRNAIYVSKSHSEYCLLTHIFKLLWLLFSQLHRPTLAFPEELGTTSVENDTVMEDYRVYTFVLSVYSLRRMTLAMNTMQLWCTTSKEDWLCQRQVTEMRSGLKSQQLTSSSLK